MNKSAGWIWVNKMGQAWIDKNPQAILPLFAEKFTYYESPFEKPLITKKELIALWQDVPNFQKDISFDFEIIGEKNNQCLAHFQASFTRIKTSSHAHLDGIFLIKLNNHGLCTLFKWWWNTKE